MKFQWSSRFTPRTRHCEPEGRSNPEVSSLYPKMASPFGLAMTAMLVAAVAHAEETLSQKALFYRCYAQLTQSYPRQNDPLVVAVTNGTKTAVAACTEVLDTAQLTQENYTKIVDSAEGRAVLNTFHKLHTSWFRVRNYNDVGNGLQRFTGDMYDVESPAFYFDRALFRPNTPVSTVFTYGRTLRAVRTAAELTNGPISNQPKALSSFTTAFRFAATGALLGIEDYPDTRASYSFFTNVNNQAGTTRTGTIDLDANHGGGIIGSAPYLLQNVDEGVTFAADGGLKMPRKWSRGVLGDLLCRSLPVVKTTDVGSFRVANATVPFRRDNSCLQCHATMDRMASVLRNFRYSSIGSVNPVQTGGTFPKLLPTTHGAYTAWPANGVSAFAPPTRGDDLSLPPPPTSTTPGNLRYNLTTPSGTFYFRDYRDQLINQPLTDVASLNDLLKDLPDFYVCVAKRYYAYFLGVDVDLNPLATGESSDTDAFHKAAVIALGLDLKDHANDRQKLRRLIQKIISLPQYQKSSFGTERGN